MAIKLFASRSAWQRVFQDRPGEWEQRVFEIHGAEEQVLPVQGLEKDSMPVRRLQAHGAVRMDPSLALVLEDCIWDNALGEILLPFMPGYDAARKEAGDTIAACNRGLSPWASYGHFLIDQAGLQGLYENHPRTRGLPLLVNGVAEGNCSRLLAEFWPEAQVIRSRFTLIRTMHHVIHRYWLISRRVAAYLRGLAFPRELPPARRLYFARTGRRQIRNEAEVARYLGSLGFERVEDRSLIGLTLAEQARIFASAERIVSPHGSHLASCFFCRPGCVLVECFNAAWTDCNSLAALRSTGQEACYRYLIDWSPLAAGETPIGAPIEVEMAKLKAVLEGVL
jgi:hypothetical protein